MVIKEMDNKASILKLSNRNDCFRGLSFVRNCMLRWWESETLK